ncbi:DoxX family protein [Hyphococcus sp.]|jgi:putative oxidoreductase|uniref:DoxX family protein n=1 Tax=Hyphococcus sp. TaxID=2038636 RepID=UPI003D1175CD
MNRLLFLQPLARFQDLTLLTLRVLTGAFLMWGTWDNIADPARMTEFVQFLDAFKFPAPEAMAPLSVWFQFGCGALLILGLLTRWAGLIMAFNFIVAFLMVHLADNFRAQFPALILIAVSLHFVAAGGGKFSLDRLLK